MRIQSAKASNPIIKIIANVTSQNEWVVNRDLSVCSQGFKVAPRVVNMRVAKYQQAKRPIYIDVNLDEVARIINFLGSPAFLYPVGYKPIYVPYGARKRRGLKPRRMQIVGLNAVMQAGAGYPNSSAA